MVSRTNGDETIAFASRRGRRIDTSFKNTEPAPPDLVSKEKEVTWKRILRRKSNFNVTKERETKRLRAGSTKNSAASPNPVGSATGRVKPNARAKGRKDRNWTKPRRSAGGTRQPKTP